LLTLVVPGNTVSAEAQELFVWGISKGEALLEHCFGPGMLGISGRIWGIAFEAIVETLVCFSDNMTRDCNKLDLVSQEATLALRWTIPLTICKWGQNFDQINELGSPSD